MKLKKISLVLMLLLTPSILFAADDGQDVADKIQDALYAVINIVGPLAMVCVLAFNGGLTYMTKNKDQRSAEDGDQLKQLLFRVLIGGGLMIGAANLGVWVWGLLGGN